VARLAERVAPLEIDALYTSPIERARQTAAAIARVLKLQPIDCDPLGALQYGDWTGAPRSVLERDPRFSRFNHFRSGTRIPNGETMLEVQTRAVAELLRLRDRHVGQTLALVSHGDVIKAIALYVLGMSLDLCSRIEVGPASITCIEIDPDGVRLMCLNASVE
ncbi:MAG TPA: histidine phosphatase family protein, partial [Polyangiales bacterium]|nr:histidine phosphatase family protein [Polyangiales bacterium]